MKVHTLRQQGLSIRKIAGVLGISRNAVRRALKSAAPPSGKRNRAQGIKLAPYMSLVDSWLQDSIKTHWTAARMLDELHDRGYEGGYTVLKEHVRKHRPRPAQMAEARFYVKPGQQLQVDWAEMGPVTIDGVERKLYVFVATMAWSRALFIRFTTDMQMLNWLHCHRSAFEYFGGVPSEVLIDNLKTGVLSRAGATVRWQANYQTFAVALGFTPIAHFPMRPKTKGRVERIVRFVRERFFIGRDIFSLDLINEEALQWLGNRANARIHRITRQRPCDRFAVEQAALHALPEYDIVVEDTRVADAYALVSYNDVRYSIPPQHARQTVTLQLRPTGLTLLRDGKVLVRHAYAKPGIHLVQLPEHLPPKPKPRHERFAELGDGIGQRFGDIGRRYVAAVERRAPHAPLVLLREVFEREEEFGAAVVTRALETLLEFQVVKRNALSPLCYRFGKTPRLRMVLQHNALPAIDVERRPLTSYDEVAV